MKHMTLALGLPAACLLAVSVAQAGNCCPGHGQAANPAELTQAGCGGHAHDHGMQRQEPQAADAPDTEIKLQTTCPVMGGKIDKSLYVDHDGKRIYICCKGCEAPVKKDPAKYIRKLEESGVTLARLQTTCPVKIDKALFVDHEGKRIHVCNKECLAEVRKDPAKHIKAMEKCGVALEPAANPGNAAEAEKRRSYHSGQYGSCH